MIPLYPLRFNPIFKEKIWGGRKLHDILHKKCGDIGKCGESWEISTVDNNISVVAEGPLKGKRLDHLIHEYRSALLGKKVYARYKDEFPLLIKFLDAQDDLSIQVHPDNQLAWERHQQMGKTEMWYIIQSDPGSTLITGFNQPLDKEKFQSMLETGRIEEILNRETAEPGDVFFIPAGRIHTIGKGILLAEIQQTSDVTYRIYDFDRTDDMGNKRELHVEQSLEALDFMLYDQYKTRYVNLRNEENTIVDSEYFTTAKLWLDQPIHLGINRQTFRILIILRGSLKLDWQDDHMSASMGDVILIPASMKEIKLIPAEGDVELLEVKS
ncbi:type I phosphomannose isomerase catalytic subunit [Fulvivirga sedimenti]|uniref:Class I mannose-6-phosphate isomerase n=1 Tax=Fulvivirga sedimenti TaxID=2879465 RepID=A0A9X1KUA2_9BACT|nr:type I phosphomannose isomerase catalytic subunit [Fulvivirga sedimenti]MCA6073263.1 class I mannose-6-phosphate isomerase [Fulvivirga sedimenti]